MLIILEGADGSGKTSLANRIRKDIDQYMIFVRSNGPPSNLQQLADMIGWLEEFKHHPRLTVVTDRNPVISEYIYGPIIRNKCMHGLSLEQMAKMFQDTLFIYCRPSYQALASGMRQAVQMEGVEINHKDIVRAYDTLIGQLGEEGLDIRHYDYTGPPNLTLDAIRSFIQWRK